MLAAVLALVLVAPVGGAVERGFVYGRDPFAAGQHRGADWGARRGAVVRAPCRGRVVFAGRFDAGVVTVLCSGWRVTVMPLASIAVREGAVVAPGSRVGTAAGASVHVGVRRAGVRFGYVDPLRFMRAPVSTPVLVGPPGRRPRVPRPLPARVGRAASSPVTAVPWPAWVGVALLVGAVPVRLRLRGRWALRRRTSTAAG